MKVLNMNQFTTIHLKNALKRLMIFKFKYLIIIC